MKIKINKLTKITLLNAIKNGYLEESDFIDILRGMPKKVLEERMKEACALLGITEPITIEIIDKREQVIKPQSHE